MSKKNQPLRIRFRSDESIGDPDAGNDSFYLKECFVDTAFFDSLTDMSNGKSLLIGRTGTGKTACIQRIKHLSETQNLKCVEVDVAQEFLGYISGLTLLKEWAETNKHNLTLFFKNMWKHIVIFSIMSKEFSSSGKCLDKIAQYFSANKKAENKLRQQLEDYVNSYGEDFWNPARSTTSEVVKSTVRELEFEGQMDIPGGGARASYRHENSEASSTRGNEAHDKIHAYFRKQMLQSQAAIESISEYIKGNYRGSFYVLIDKLDEEWIDESIRYHLIRALVETVRDLYHGNDEHPIKVVVAMRTDLIQKVYEVTRSSGFQSEKYHAFETRIEWGRKDLALIVNKRIDHMCQSWYTTQRISIQDLAPPQREKDKKLIEYIMDRTLGRPRDVISFVNHILRDLGKEQRDKLTRRVLNRVEREYSAERFASVMDEWYSLYPHLKIYARVLEDEQFKTHATFAQFRGIVADIVIGADSSNDLKLDEWMGMVENKSDDVAVDFLDILYRTGLVRIKPNATSSVMAYPEAINFGQYKKEMAITIHPMFYGKFGIDKRT